MQLTLHRWRRFSVPLTGTLSPQDTRTAGLTVAWPDAIPGPEEQGEGARFVLVQQPLAQSVGHVYPGHPRTQCEVQSAFLKRAETKAEFY